MKQGRNKGNNVKNATKRSGHIRIISGKYRGRKLAVLDAQGLRPTTDRVKETLFNWLIPYIQDSVCLDCFSGAGSLGFEALSRNAKSVDMIELNKSAANQLNINKQLLSANNCQVFNSDSLQYLAQPPLKHYDLVFIDPPFHQQLAEKAMELLRPWLKSNALVYLEREVNSNNIELPDNWSLLKEKTAGQVIYQLYQLVEL